MTQIKHAAVLFVGLLLSAGCSEILTDYSFYTPDASDDGGQQLTDAGEPVDAGCAFRCDGVCTDTQRDPLHCGSCGHSCSAPENASAVCEQGACGFECDTGYFLVVGRCEPRSAPRPIAPLSTATVTSRRPTFRWELGARGDGARLEICADRACNIVLETVDASGTSGRPSSDLPSGVVFWRLYGREGGEVGTTPSVTWQLYVGARSAPIDTSWGTTLDVNGDGFADVLVGAPAAADGSGRAYLYLGGGSGLGSTPTVLDNGADGGRFGCSVASAGDVNGDGYADIIIGAYGANTAGRAYVYLGAPEGLRSGRVALQQGDHSGFGYSVASAGDLDGDGYADVIVGAPYHGGEAGRVHIYFGGASGLGPTPTTIDNGADGGLFGWSVASAGDIDGDGHAEVIIGAIGANDYGGRGYLYSGTSSGIDVDPIAINNPSGGSFGGSVAGVGDVNSDGHADVLIGASGVSSYQGRAYLYLGGADGLESSPAVLDNSGVGGGFGQAVGSAGDVDGDGYADILVAAPEAVSHEGRVYVFSGSPGGVERTPTILDNGADAGNFGHAVGSSGDIDGNGHTDVLVGAPYVASAAGRAYAYFGATSGLLPSPTVLDGASDSDEFGGSVSR